MEWSLGQMVISKQGRDVGTVYVVVKIEDHFCYTADGRKTLNDREYKVFGKNGIECIEQDISDERMAQLLENEFNINLSTLK